MSIKLDDVELVKRIEDPMGRQLREIRSVNRINVVDRRSVVRLDIPGFDGDVLQDMGSRPVTIHIFGEFFGKETGKAFNSIKSKFDSNEPLRISSNVVELSDLRKVKIEQFSIEKVAGSSNKFAYHMVLNEYLQSE